MSLALAEVSNSADERRPELATSPEFQQMLGEAGRGDAEKRVGGCARPVRLVGSSKLADTATGETSTSYSSTQELDGVTYIRCGNRGAQVCPSCSAEPSMTQDVYMGRRAANSPAVTALEQLIPLPEDDE